LVPTKLTKRRFLGPVLQFDIDQYKAENSADPNVIFLEEPIPAIAPIREILTVTREEPLMHEVIAQWDQSEATTEYDRHNWSIGYEPVNCKSTLDCSLHWTEVEHLPETQTFILGASRYDPEVIEMQKKRVKRRAWVKELQLWRDYLIAAELFFVTDMLTEEEEEEEEEAN
ncbi:MAG: hypothetical protein M3114_02660, partial [Thermoproteota archaeon]|nr:hypothetical protein [Thermoproteota archaeon]